ncbi:MAG: hypothetical protein GVY14_12875 [Spirochaetes bacterium]|jgi:hypothetical protein|nr:hypothetical protein [Spirochaetota bacterium]
MEELFQLILALLVLSFPLLSILSRRRQAGRTRRGGARAPRVTRGWRRRRRGEAAEEGENGGARADTGELMGSGAEEATRARRREGAERSGRTQRGGQAGGEGLGRAGAGRLEDTAGAGRPRQPQAAALERIARRSRLQQAVIWAEVLGRPRALRRSSDPWDDEGTL